MSCGNTFWNARKVRLEELIVIYEDAMLAFGDNNTQSYTLDTGQTRQTVQRAEIGSLKNTLKNLYSTYDDVCARTEGATVNIRPTR